MGPNSPPSPLPSFPTAAIGDSCSQHVAFLPGHRHCPAQPALSPAPQDLPAVLASMGQLLPLALAMLIHGGQDAEAPALPCCLRAEPLLAGSARRGASCYSWRVFNDDGQSDTHRSCCQTRERGPGFVLMAGWVPQARRRWERGPGPVLTVQGRMLQPENSNRAPSPASLAGTPTRDPQRSSVPTGHCWHQTAIPEKRGEKKGLGENLRAGKILGKQRAHGQEGERAAGWA